MRPNYEFVACLLLNAGFGLAASLQVSSVTTPAGATVPIALNLASISGTAPAAIQWDFSHDSRIAALSENLGSAGTSSGKTLSCSGSRCVLYGMNANAMSTGAIAILNITLSSTASGTITIQPYNVLAIVADASYLPIGVTAGTISISAPISVAVTPSVASLSASQTRQLTATVTGGSGSTAVTWSVSPNVGAISGSGLYTAPASISSQQTVVATARSVADPAKSASCAIRLLAPINVTVSPPTVWLSATQTQQFAATVTGGTGSRAVTWTLSPSIGRISSTGLYTAPYRVRSQRTVLAIATSVADSSKSASSTITLLQP